MQHIAFIMDGNRRWAKKLGNLVKIGHENGGKKFEEVIEWSYDANIPFVSFWALSKENILERSKEELEAIYAIFRSSFSRLLTLALEKNIKLESVGDLWLVPPDIRTNLLDAIEKTKNGTKMTIILAIAYSGQDEIIRAFRQYIALGNDASVLDEKKLLEFLDSGAFPPPDLIVRT
jgi:undecaprenyl diphosphate synthase